MRFWYVQFKVVFLLGQTSPACCLIITEYLCMESGTWSLIQNPWEACCPLLLTRSFVRFHVFLGAYHRPSRLIFCLSFQRHVLLTLRHVAQRIQTSSCRTRLRVGLVVQLETRPRVSSCFKSNLHAPAAIGSTMPLSDRSQSEHEHLLRLSIPLHLHPHRDYSSSSFL
jgi:hypothetical protein